MESPILRAVLSHYIAQRDKTISELDIYINRPSGVGEHANVTNEVIRLFKELDESVSIIGTVKGVMEGSENKGEGDNGEVKNLIDTINQKLNEKK